MEAVEQMMKKKLFRWYCCFVAEEKNVSLFLFLFSFFFVLLFFKRRKTIWCTISHKHKDRRCNLKMNFPRMIIEPTRINGHWFLKWPVWRQLWHVGTKLAREPGLNRWTIRRKTCRRIYFQQTSISIWNLRAFFWFVHLH